MYHLTIGLKTVSIWNGEASKPFVFIDKLYQMLVLVTESWLTQIALVNINISDS